MLPLLTLNKWMRAGLLHHIHSWLLHLYSLVFYYLIHVIMNIYRKQTFFCCYGLLWGSFISLSISSFIALKFFLDLKLILYIFAESEKLSTKHYTATELIVVLQPVIRPLPSQHCFDVFVALFWCFYYLLLTSKRCVVVTFSGKHFFLNFLKLINFLWFLDVFLSHNNVVSHWEVDDFWRIWPVFIKFHVQIWRDGMLTYSMKQCMRSSWVARHSHFLENFLLIFIKCRNLFL